MRQHKHDWNFAGIEFGAPAKKAPTVVVVWHCLRCKANRSIDLKVRVPSSIAPTDAEIGEREMQRRLAKREKNLADQRNLHVDYLATFHQGQLVIA